MSNLLQLVMIVKNSGSDVIDMLSTVQPFIDYWTILDTGSTDGTQERILEFMTKPGKLYEEPFVDFATSRNRALDLAGDICTFTIMLDDTYHFDDGNKIRQILKKEVNKKFDYFAVNIVDKKNIYKSNRILRASSKIRYKYKIHEIIDPQEHHKLKFLDINIKDIQSNFMTIRTYKRHASDILLLKEQIEENPDDRRAMIHLVRTYISSLNYKKISIDIIKEEINKILKYNLRDSVDYEARILLFSIINGENDIEDYIKILKETNELYPKQGEPSYYLATIYRDRNEINLAYEWIMKAIFSEPEGNLLIKHNIYNYEIPYLAADLAIVNKKYGMAEKILKKYSNNGDYRLANMIYNISNIPQPEGKKFNTPCIVIHAGETVKGWNPEILKPKFSKIKCSGSEIMTINLAKQFQKFGYRIFVFGKFKSELFDSQGVFDGVQYIDSNYYWDFLKEYVVNYLIVSRVNKNLVYLNNVKKVYLWLHDLTHSSENNISSIQFHKEKFKKIICLSDWHAKYYSETAKVPIDNIYVSRNAILSYKYERPHKKIPYRFIYSSSADRGLEHLLAMIPKVKERYPETTLEIFTSIKNTVKCNAEQMIDTINKLDYVTLHDRVSQEEIIYQYAISDVWLYPTDFKETYCITALEAQACGVLCATVNLGSLVTTVGDRGILVDGNINNEEIKENLLNKLFEVMDNKEEKQQLIDKARTWALKQNFSTLVDEWRKDLFKL
jgi:hypothetical protein